MKDLQTVLDALENMVESVTGVDQVSAVNEAREAIAIVKQMMQAEPIAWLSIDSIGERYLCFSKPKDNDQVQALYTAPQTASEWQPIESAPKDGTRILVRGYGATFVAGFEKVINCDFYGWVVANDIHIEPKHATHWMPLPSAPKDAP